MARLKGWPKKVSNPFLLSGGNNIEDLFGLEDLYQFLEEIEPKITKPKLYDLNVVLLHYHLCLHLNLHAIDRVWSEANINGSDIKRFYKRASKELNELFHHTLPTLISAHYCETYSIFYKRAKKHNKNLSDIFSDMQMNFFILEDAIREAEAYLQKAPKHRRNITNPRMKLAEELGIMYGLFVGTPTTPENRGFAIFLKRMLALIGEDVSQLRPYIEAGVKIHKSGAWHYIQ